VRATTWNKIIDATRAYYQGQATLGQKPAGVSSPAAQASVVLVKNASGSDQPRFAVLGIDKPIISVDDNEDEFKRQVALSCVSPSETDHRYRFVILLNPLKDGAIGRACVSGVTIARLQIDNDDDTTAGIADGDATKLKAGRDGTATILWKQDTDGSDGTRWAILQLGSSAGARFFYAKLTGHARIDDNRWSYSFTEQSYLTTGKWKDTPLGISGTAYNTIEANGSVDGVQGNGVNASNLPTGVDIQPIGIGAVMRIDIVTDCDTGDDAYVFQAVNQVDGACDS